jgi:hypothetical protein
MVEAQTINGKVTGENNEPVEYATVVLQTPDSLYVNSTYTDSSGIFNLLVEMTSYRLTDLFNSWTPDMIMKYNTQNLRMNVIPDSRAVSLLFTFKLGGYDKTHKEIDASRFGTK